MIWISLGTVERHGVLHPSKIIENLVGASKRKTVATVSLASSEESLASLYDVNLIWND